jgi:hypothetical protein
MHKKIQFLLAIIVTMAVSACAKPPAQTPTAAPSPTLPLSTDTPIPTTTLTLAPTATATSMPTLTQTPTYTVTPFPGFGERFKFYQAWTADETTYFYFMNAQVDQTIYAIVDDLEGNQYTLTCPPDEQYPADIRCFSDTLFKGKTDYRVTFYSDPERQYPFYENVFATDLNTRYMDYDNCEKEYRIYDGKCYSAITCYGENGEVVYTFDNIPYGGNFEGYALPCP